MATTSRAEKATIELSKISAAKPTKPTKYGHIKLAAKLLEYFHDPPGPDEPGELCTDLTEKVMRAYGGDAVALPAHFIPMRAVC